MSLFLFTPVHKGSGPIVETQTKLEVRHKAMPEHALGVLLVPLINHVVEAELIAGAALHYGHIIYARPR